MGRNGKPGASLITFVEFDSRINVTGADIDRKILFTANHVKCFFIDQTELDSYYALASQVGINQFDFIIDDGLHSTEANLNSLIFAQNHLTWGGYLIIEDIPDNSLPVWNVVIGIMRSKGHEISITRATRCNVIIFRNSL
jgi:cephalosporin hydroxylase